MNKLFSLTLVALAVSTLCATVSAQVVTGPIITSYRPSTDEAPTVTYSPVIESAVTTGPVVTHSPVVPQATTTYYQRPITVARPVVQPTTTYYQGPVTVARPVVQPTTTYYQGPVTVARPVVQPTTTYAPIAAAPVITYRPVAPVVAVPAPVVTYRPAATVYATPAPVIAYRPPVVAYYAPGLPAYSPTTYSTYPTVVARPVVVSQKVYIPGRPIRNFFQAITP